MTDKMSLEEYAKQYGKQEQAAEDKRIMTAIASDLEKQEADAAKAADLKESILQQLEQGNEPQYVLYTALKCIGLLSQDDAWTETATADLDKIYGDLAQQSFIVDNAAIAAKRLQDQEAKYNQKLRTQLVRQLRGYKNIADSLTEAFGILNSMEQAEAETPSEQDN